MEITGRIRVIDETKTFGANGFRNRDIVVTTDEQYPQHIQIQFTQDKCDILNSYKVGEPVKVAINLRGREWVNPQGETKYFNSIQGWRIERTAQADGRQNSAVNNYQQQQAQNNTYNEAEHDDLPF